MNSFVGNNGGKVNGIPYLSAAHNEKCAEIIKKCGTNLAPVFLTHPALWLLTR